MAYERGMVDLGADCRAFLQPDGGWGWSNAGLVTGGGRALLVDTFFDLPLTRDLLAACAAASGGAPIDVLVNTHHNGDHCHGNQLVSGARIVGHENCREYMVRGGAPTMLQGLRDANDDGGTISYMKRSFGAFDFRGISPVPPTETFTGDSLDLTVGGRPVKLLYLGPAHTMGDIAVWVPDAGVLFTGDLLFYGSTPLIWEGSLTNWMRALDELGRLGARTVVPGHGPVADPDAFASMRGYLELVVEQGTDLKSRGLTPAEAAGHFDPGPYRDWTDGERIVLNFLRLWSELDGAPPDAPVDSAGAFAAMADLAARR